MWKNKTYFGKKIKGGLKILLNILSNQIIIDPVGGGIEWNVLKKDMAGMQHNILWQVLKANIT